MNFILVMLGGAIGSGLRYSIHYFLPVGDGSFPYNTLIINIVGSFVVGIVVTIAPTQLISREWSLLLGAGFCGGFTTFSAFSFETLYLIQNHKEWLAFFYVATSVVGGLAAAWGGWIVGRQL